MMYRRVNKRTQCSTEYGSFQITKIHLNRKTTFSICLFSASLLFLCFDVGKAGNAYRYDTNNINIPETCKNLNETKAAQKLERICQDCYDLFKVDNLMHLCRKDCYSSIYFPSCLVTLCFWSEKDSYRQMIENLSGNKFAVWHHKEVKLKGDSEANQTTVYDSDNTNSGSYCQSK